MKGLQGWDLTVSQRWFLVRNVHAKEQLSLLQPRWAMSLMLGPMTRTEIRQALGKNTEAVPPVEQAKGKNEPEEEP